MLSWVVSAPNPTLTRPRWTDWTCQHFANSCSNCFPNWSNSPWSGTCTNTGSPTNDWPANLVPSSSNCTCSSETETFDGAARVRLPAKALVEKHHVYSLRQQDDSFTVKFTESLIYRCSCRLRFIFVLLSFHSYAVHIMLSFQLYPLYQNVVKSLMYW